MKLFLFFLMIQAYLVSSRFAINYDLHLTKTQKKESVVRLHIITSERVNTSFELKYDYFKANEFSKACPGDSKPLLKFIMHGFAETWHMSFRWNWIDSMLEELFKTPEASKLCVIVVDWKELANGGKLISNYWKAISNMKIAGDLMTEFFRVNPIEEKNMHCIGFSLGMLRIIRFI